MKGHPGDMHKSLWLFQPGKKKLRVSGGGEKVVERRNTIGAVGDVRFTDQDFQIDMGQEQHDEFVVRIKGVEESETDEEDFEQEHYSREDLISLAGN